MLEIHDYECRFRRITCLFDPRGRRDRVFLYLWSSFPHAEVHNPQVRWAHEPRVASFAVLPKTCKWQFRA